MRFPYRKILVVGCGGAGKSTLAREIGARFSIPIVHLDRIWWLPGWQARTQEEFDALLAIELAKPAWVIDGNFKRTFAMRLDACDCCILLDIDADTCLQGAYARAEQYCGTNRPDMTEGCEEIIRPEFEDWILEFRNKTLPLMLSHLTESGKPYFVFQTREAAYEWLNQFE